MRQSPRVLRRLSLWSLDAPSDGLLRTLCIAPTRSRSDLCALYRIMSNATSYSSQTFHLLYIIDIVSLHIPGALPIAPPHPALQTRRCQPVAANPSLPTRRYKPVATPLHSLRSSRFARELWSVSPPPPDPVYIWSLLVSLTPRGPLTVVPPIAVSVPARRPLYK